MGACKHAYNACARSHDSYARYTRAKPWRASLQPPSSTRTHTRARDSDANESRAAFEIRAQVQRCACTHAERKAERRERRVPDALEACTAQNRYGESSRIISFASGLRTRDARNPRVNRRPQFRRYRPDFTIFESLSSVWTRVDYDRSRIVLCTRLVYVIHVETLVTGIQCENVVERRDSRGSERRAGLFLDNFFFLKNMN